MVGSSVAIPAASLCINRRLYQIASVQSVTKTRAERRRDVIIDLAIGVGLPILGMILRECHRTDSSEIVADLRSDTVVQSYRFIIIEEVGCFPFTWNTPLAYPLYLAWPVIIGLVSASYCSTYAQDVS
jgi:pheromone a factor receptor